MSRRRNRGQNENRPYDEDDDDEESNERTEDFDYGYETDPGYDDDGRYFQPPPPDAANPLITFPIRQAPPAAGAAAATGVGASQVPQAYANYTPAPVTAPRAGEVVSDTDNFPYYDDGPKRANEAKELAERRIDRASIAMGIERKGVYGIMFQQHGQNNASWQLKWNTKEKGRKRAEEDHKNKIDPNHENYDATYHQYWTADKANRRAFNAQRRASALAHRRAYDVAQGRPQAADPDPAEDSGDERYAPRQWNDSPAATAGPFRQDPPAGFPLLGHLPPPGKFLVGIKTNPPSDRCEPCEVAKKECNLGERGWYPCSRCVEQNIVAQCVNGKGRLFNPKRYNGWQAPVGGGIPSNTGPPPSRSQASRAARTRTPPPGTPPARSRRSTTLNNSGGGAPEDSDEEEDDDDYAADGKTRKKQKRKAQAGRTAPTLILRGRPRGRSASPDRSAAAPTTTPGIPTIYVTKPKLMKDFITPTAADRVVRTLGQEPKPGQFPLGIRTNPHSNKCLRCHLLKKGTCDLQVTGYPCTVCADGNLADECVNGPGYKTNRQGSLRDLLQQEALKNQQNATATFNEGSEANPQPAPKPKPKPRPTGKTKLKARIPGRSRSPAERRHQCDLCKKRRRKCTGDPGACVSRPEQQLLV
jgi:hypothetical protein